MANGKTIRERLIRQETKFEDFMVTWNTFLTNDFKHLKADVVKVKKSTAWIIGLLITTETTLIVGLLYIILTR